MEKNTHLKKHEIAGREEVKKKAGREEVKDKAGSKFWHANVISEIWALTVIDSTEYYHSQSASPSPF